MDDLYIRIIIPLIAVHARTEIGKVITPELDLVAAHTELVPDIQTILNHRYLIIRHQHVIPSKHSIPSTLLKIR